MTKRRIKPERNNQMVDPLQWAHEYLPSSEFTQLQKVLEEVQPLSIRINLLKANAKSDPAKWAATYHWDTAPIPFCPSGYWISKAGTPPSKTFEHKLGYYYIQEAASMLPSELFDLNGIEHPIILDMAASPGGKTIHLVDRSMDSGLVIANDASKSRIPALRIVLQNWGAINQAITCLPGEAFGSVYPEMFDAVLLDAPCSMQGLRISTSHKMRPITENEIQTLAERQVRLLESALRAVKTGGQVVYATCTLSPMENENVISKVLDKFRNMIELEDIQERLSSPAPTLAEFGVLRFNAEVSRAARLWPHIFGTAGFFSAKFIKKAPLNNSPRTPIRKNPPAKGRLLPEKEALQMTEEISDRFGFNLEETIERQGLLFYEQKGDYYLSPSQFDEVFISLPVLSKGMMIGKAMPRSWQMSHAFASRFGDRFTEKIYPLNSEFLNAWRRGEDIRGISPSVGLTGEVVLVSDGTGNNLGRAKVLTDRLKNMLPTRLF